MNKHFIRELARYLAAETCGCVWDDGFVGVIEHFIKNEYRRENYKDDAEFSEQICVVSDTD